MLLLEKYPNIAKSYSRLDKKDQISSVAFNNDVISSAGIS